MTDARTYHQKRGRKEECFLVKVDLPKKSEASKIDTTGKKKLADVNEEERKREEVKRNLGRRSSKGIP